MKNNVLIIGLIFMMTIVCGCGPKKVASTGFLSDYSRLEPFSGTSMRYVDRVALGTYSSFIVDPVTSRIYGEARAKISAEDLKDMTNYMHAAVVRELSGGYAVAYRPGPGVARIRVAITDLKKSNPVLNTIPQTKLAGVGLGGASMEAEMIDSQTGRQIGAAVESQLGERLSLAGMTTWGDAKQVMDNWAKRLKTRLDEAH